MNFLEKTTFIHCARCFQQGTDTATVLPCIIGEKVPKIAPRSDSFEAVLFCGSHGILTGS